MYCSEVIRAISLASRNSKPIKEELKQEIEYWNILDEWTGGVSSRKEQHFQLVLANDSSKFRWRAFMVTRGRIDEFGNLWDINSCEESICIVECFVVCKR